jgi:hypothetical protein
MDHLIGIIVSGILVTAVIAGVTLPLGAGIYVLFCKLTGRKCRIKVACSNNSGSDLDFNHGMTSRAASRGNDIGIGYRSGGQGFGLYSGSIRIDQ